MKVLMLTKYFLPHIGGVEIHVHKVAAELAKRGYDVTVCCANTEGLPLSERVGKTADNYFVVRDYKWAHANWPGFDIVHVHDFEQYIPGCDRQFITFHGYEGHVPPDKGIARTRRNICSSVLGTIHIGNYLRKWYGTSHKHDFTLLGGVDPAPMFQARLPDKPARIAYVGRISEDKKTVLYQQAAEQLGDNAALDIITDLPHNQVRAMWDKHDLAFCNGQLSMLEAMACGVPVIALESNAMVADMLVDFPVIKVKTVGEIVGVVKLLGSKPKLYKELSRNHWTAANLCTWGNAVNVYEKLWKQAV